MTCKKTIGILGGMGPLATVTLFKRILALTPATRDQDHLRILIDNNPQIPDRTAAILGGGESPLPMMVQSARNLERAGADFLIIPCNTAHHWLSQLEEVVSIPVIDMVSETVAEVATNKPPLQTIALLATTGTIMTSLYQQALAEKDITVLVPTREEQGELMSVIYRIKARDYEVNESLKQTTKRLLDRGAQGLITGCTELSLVLKEEETVCPLFDPLSVLAQRAVARAKGKSERR